MRVVHDARNVLIDHFESSNRVRPPLISMLAQQHDCQLAVHFCNCQPPWHSLLLVVPEIGDSSIGLAKRSATRS